MSKHSPVRRRLVWLALACLPAVVLAQSPTVAGEVMKIDKAGGRLTLKQGEIKSLDMPPMTLTWRLSQPRLLDDLTVGDRVRFVGARIDGQYTITALTKAPQ